MAFHIEEFKIGEEIGLHEIKKIEIEILKKFADFCEENGLRYFLAGGTLVGAVRHGGFVPWDDDVDIVMPRPDWEKFLSLNRINFFNYKVLSFQYTPDIHPRPLFRIVDNQYVTQIDHIQKFLNVWIDVLPLDGLPESYEDRYYHYKKAKILKWIIARSYSNFYKEKNLIKKCIKFIICFPLRIIGPNFFIRVLDKLAKKYSYDESSFVGSFVAGYGFREGVSKNNFEKVIRMNFEDREYNIPVGYDYLLRHIYGNYMKFPKNKKSHIICAWKNAEV